MFAVDPVNHLIDEQIQHKINQKTKPLGALGTLESLAKQIAKVQLSGSFDPTYQLAINKPAMLVFAGDHGIANYGVSIAPSEVTQQMVSNFANGGAAINVFCRQMGLNLEVIDCGILTPCDHPSVTRHRLGAGTQAIHQKPAMDIQAVKDGFSYAQEVVQRHFDSGCNLIALGEMGIGNTSSAAAIMAAMLKLDVKECVGRGTGIDDDTFLRKCELLTVAMNLHRDKLNDPMSVLACLGGFEIVQMTGAILAAAEKKMLVVVDGFIATAAALVAVALSPEAKSYLIFAHQSDEQGHQKMLQELDAQPLLSLGLRLGEGTGAALSLPIIQAAVNFYNEMASFENAGVSNVV
ncbi:nicotinate-nucleotide--dimethylbenzimidazole phosphoribosyltransferase [Vibrio sp. UCD-FRSSP16_10]|uniref:nicotinate-nucleotide--dimethylbenzimidazole phosphoribosyltransferase n=1 Tax=unclassified Vibrio TaxID=2614977 RepID=UPI0007FD9617|nr:MULTISPECIES: nicotinate-nucleotide--dimethylbenzimidazole phosphoribosyltransferase [unclassified Vibrio]OBT07873.1 nicotinate-nucleotide--dimethylbenzimidazole phosphoribosyltransferase [Vibrio sp. UCD-FRSSP16_30]OBT17049.1 nicotinate-nucleotide--dimethylbenzimidazole phosphoribosyltransferase [Vibrio sp. UCD-FRSSP16_10]